MNLGLVITISLGVFLGLVIFNYHSQIINFFYRLLLLIIEIVQIIWSKIGYIFAFLLIFWFLEGFKLSTKNSLIISFATVYFFKIQKDEGGIKNFYKARLGNVTWQGWLVLVGLGLTLIGIYFLDQ